MTDTPIANSSKPKLITWLWNPFTRMAGWPALLAGCNIMLITGWIGAGTNTHFDGVLDTHVGFKAPLWFFLSESFINWVSLFSVLLVASLFVTRGRNFRAIDLIGTQALARWPFLVTSIATYIPGFTSVTTKLNKLAASGQLTSFPDVTASEIAAFAAVSFIMLLMTVWFIALAWKSFRISCDAKGWKAVTAFVISVILAEVISKIAIHQILQHLLSQA